MLKSNDYGTLALFRRESEGDPPVKNWTIGSGKGAAKIRQALDEKPAIMHIPCYTLRQDVSKG